MKKYKVDVRIFEMNVQDDQSHTMKMISEFGYEIKNDNGKFSLLSIRKYIKKTYGLMFDKCLNLFQAALKSARENNSGRVNSQDYKVSGRDQQKIQEEVR